MLLCACVSFHRLLDQSLLHAYPEKHAVLPCTSRAGCCLDGCESWLLLRRLCGDPHPEVQPQNPDYMRPSSHAATMRASKNGTQTIIFDNAGQYGVLQVMERRESHIADMHAQSFSTRPAHAQKPVQTWAERAMLCAHRTVHAASAVHAHVRTASDYRTRQ